MLKQTFGFMKRFHFTVCKSQVGEVAIQRARLYKVTITVSKYYY